MEELVRRPEHTPERKRSQGPLGPRRAPAPQPAEDAPVEPLEEGEAEAERAASDLVHSLTRDEPVQPLLVPCDDPLVTRVDSLEDAYEELGVLGRGGMGVVLLARERESGEEVALKRLQRHVDAARFLREARTVAALDHPAVVRLRRVVATREREDEVALVLELVRGSDLAARIQSEGALPLETSLRLAHSLAQALAYAHERGVVHRDVKPANVLLDEDGRPHLTDFGLALSVDLQSLVETGTWCGTLDYMAPEQRTRADRADPRADVFGLGATLYHMLTGSSPRVIREGRLPELARQLVLRCVEEHPRDRFPDMRALIQALERALARCRRDSSGTRAPLARIADDYRQALERTSRSGRVRRLAVASGGLAALGLLPADAPQRLEARLEVGEGLGAELEHMVSLILDAATRRDRSASLLADAYAVLSAALAGAELDEQARRALDRLARASRRPSLPDLSERLGHVLRELVKRRALQPSQLAGLAARAASDSPAEVLDAILATLRGEAQAASDEHWPAAEARWRHALRDLSAALPEVHLAERLRRELLSVELESLSRLEDDELDEDEAGQLP